MNNKDVKFMCTALRLARRGIGLVEPNPAVGCVIVKNDRIIGKGRHKKFGGPHAEINAFENCKKRGENPQAATMYVTLEPCCHYGKMPPCTEAIIAAGISKVVAAVIDPSAHANGKGIEQLRSAGIKVRTGLCEDEARLLNAPFMKFAENGKCWIILKWAQSIDGKLAYAYTGHEQRWISNELSRKDAHNLRRRVQAILVGIKTVIADDPLLTARPAKGRKAMRVILDTNLKIPPDCRLLATAKKIPVLLVTTEDAVEANLEKVSQIKHKGAEILTVPGRQGRCDIRFLLDELAGRGIAQVLIEGGPTVLAAFLKENLADEICVYIAPKILGSAGVSNISEPMAELTQELRLHRIEVKRFDNDICLTGIVNSR